MEIEKLVHCLSELERLKQVERGLNVGNRKESTAEHTWSCMLLADILIDLIDEPLDRLKVLEYLLYHDVVEVYAGDAKFNNPAEMQLKAQKEILAKAKILKLLPKPERYDAITSAYENKATREAYFAKAIDCLDACIRNLNDENASKEDGFTEVLIRQKYYPHVSKFGLTHQLFEWLMTELSAQNKI
jgi:putative hydrolase of HD superfamily